MNGSKTKLINGSDKTTKTGRKEPSNGSKTTDKKQHSPFKSIKNTLLLRNHKHRKSEPKPSASEPDYPKLRNQSAINDLLKERPTPKGQQRLSAQRVTLFKYNHVKVMNSVAHGHRSSSESSSSSTVTSQSTVLRRLDSNDVTTGSTKARRETCLMSDGPLEIYQIITQNVKAPAQKMAYLCLGRKDNILHPILPKLQITKLGCPEFKISILLLNPERYWIIEFLPEPGLAQVYDTITKDFESMISSVCSYKVEPNLKIFPAQANTLQSSLNQHSDPLESDESDLEYLLEDLESFSDNTNTTSDNESRDEEQTINDAFRKALRNIVVASDNSETLNGFNSKRLNSYHGTLLTSRFGPRSPIVRSISVPMRLQVFNNDSSPLSLGTWMDISSEDLTEK